MDKNMIHQADEEYNLTHSKENVGQLLPVIKDSKGRIVDGLHRTETDPNWRVEIREDISTDEDYWKARAHLNYTRRNAHEAREEKLKIINELAEVYEKQGNSVLGTKLTSNISGEGGKIRNEVLDAVIKALDGAISENFIRVNIDDKYIQGQRPLEAWTRFTNPEKKPAMEMLERDKSHAESRYGKNFIERLKTEVKQQVLQDPEILKEASSRLNQIIIEKVTKQTIEERSLNECRTQSLKYRDLIEDTYYKIRGWGLPMILAMGPKEWTQAKAYIEGIHNWTGWLLGLNPSLKHATPPKESLPVDSAKVIEAEYQIKEALN